MCKGKECKCGGGCGSHADGSLGTYDPAMVGSWIHKHLIPQASVSEIKSAYPKVMVYFDANKISASQENIVKHAEDLKKAISDPDFLKNMNADEKTDAHKALKFIAGIVVVCIILIVAIKNS